MSETIENVKKEEIIKPDYTKLYKTRGRPTMKPEDKKPRKRKSKMETVEKLQLEELPKKDDLEGKVHKLEALKEQWNGYYRQNRQRILCRKKELREAKERMLNEALGVVK
jgi:hypothetical protein